MTVRLEVEHLEVRYGDLIGVADVSLRVEEGQVVALLGSNGAGKTTTLNAIAGIVKPSAGTIRWCGEEIGGTPAGNAQELWAQIDRFENGALAIAG